MLRLIQNKGRSQFWNPLPYLFDMKSPEYPNERGSFPVKIAEKQIGVNVFVML
mgnify:CR=1 FL=1